MVDVQWLDMYMMQFMCILQLIGKPLRKTGEKTHWKRFAVSIYFFEERWQKLNAKLVRKSTEIEDLLLSMKNKAPVEECMNQFSDVLDALVAVGIEYKRLKLVDEDD